MTLIRSAMVSIAGLTLTDGEKKLLSTYQPIGVTLFKRNILNPAQVAALTAQIREVIGRDNVFIGIDQEGGRVCRLTPPFFKGPYISQYGIGSLNETERLRMAELQALLIGDELRSVGINLNYAPCLDVRSADTPPVLASRCFSENPIDVAACGRKMIETYQKMKVVPCMKHLPGHGRATVDPHLNLPVLSNSLAELEKDFEPFRANAAICPMGMTAHIVIPEIDSQNPVTQSYKAITELIRARIGFDGFLISDAIDMHALKGTLPEKTRAVLAAGCDAVCYCGGREADLEAVLKETSFLTDNALERLKKCEKIFLSDSSASVNSMVWEEYTYFAQRAAVPTEDYDAVEVLHQLQIAK